MNTARSATADAFVRAPLPKRFCNLDRLLHAMKARGLDGIVATAPWNVLPHGVQRHRAQVGRAAALCRDTLAPHAGASCPHSC
jgi:hypothetical protein